MCNVLGPSIDLMQVREHLELFAILKGVEEDTLEGVVAKMADEVCFVILSPTALIFITEVYKYN